MSVHIYSVASDFSGITPKVSQLHRDIVASSIAPVLQGVQISGTTSDDVIATFDTALSAPEIVTLDGLVAAHSNVVVTAAFQFWESNPAQSTLSEAWQNAISRTADPTGGGIYRLSWSLELRIVPVDALNGGAVARFMVDGSRKGDAYHRSVEWSAFSGWDRKIFTEGDTPLLEIDYRRDPTEGGNDNVEIRKLKLGVEYMEG